MIESLVSPASPFSFPRRSVPTLSHTQWPPRRTSLGSGSVEREVELSPQADVMRRFGAVLVLEDIKGGRCDEGDVGNAVSGEIANQEASFPVVLGWRGRQCGHASTLVVIDRAAVSIDYLVQAVASPVEHVMMASIVGVDATQQLAIFIQEPQGPLAERLVIDVHEDLRARTFCDNTADVNRFKMTPGSLPDHRPVAINHGDAVGPAECEDQANILELVCPVQNSNAIKMTPFQVDSGGSEPPSDRAVGVEHGVSGCDFVPAVVVQVYWTRLMSGLVAARILYMPEQLAGAVIGVDIVVAVLDEDIAGPALAGEIGKHDAVGGILGDLDAAFLLTSLAIEFDDSAFRGEDDFGLDRKSVV